MNISDREFPALIHLFSGRSILLANDGLRRKYGVPENGKRWARGTCMAGETSFSSLVAVNY